MLRLLSFSLVLSACASTPPPAAPTATTPEAEPAAAESGAFVTLGDSRVALSSGLRIGPDEADLVSPVSGECDLADRVVILQDDDGSYRLKDASADLKSFEFDEMKMNNKRIDDGDVFRICQGELAFSIQP